MIPTDHNIVWAGVEADGIRRSTDGGVSWSTFGFLVRSSFDETNPSLALDGNTALLSWVDRRHGNQDVAYRRSADAGQTWLA